MIKSLWQNHSSTLTREAAGSPETVVPIHQAALGLHIRCVRYVPISRYVG
jgi:hypothetical protein